ncbi:MAG: hypothetical protein D6733_01635 [Methanobacteriota archaeon]|nr:MAG: hypothetical protein D6733_01635 [Euryarchaeota archaeon]
MRPGPAALLAILLLAAAAASAAPIERTELAGNISLITTSPEAGYYILALVNHNDRNVTFVEGIGINLSYPIDPASIHAVDNYNRPVEPVAVGERSILFTYNSTLPPLGYGKIFLSVKALQETGTPVPPARSAPPSTPPPTAPSTEPPAVTAPPPSPTSTPLQPHNETYEGGPPALAEEKPPAEEPASWLLLSAMGAVILLLLALALRL